jgi:hypothetical protein
MRKFLLTTRLAIAGCLALSVASLATTSPLLGATLIGTGAAQNQAPEQSTDQSAAPSASAVSPDAASAVTPRAHMPLWSREFPFSSVFGIGIDSITPSGGLDLLSSSRSTFTRRFGVYWSKVEPTEGARNWGALASFEQELINAASRNIKVVMIVGSSPGWAQAVSGRSCGPVRSDKLAAFGNFIRDAVARYSHPPYNVQYWELWNEPDIGVTDLEDPNSEFGCWGDAADPYFGGGAYAAMLKAAYPKMKAANPSVQVMIGGLLLDCDPRGAPPPGKNCTPAKFLEGILLGGGRDYFDGVSFHAYDFYGGSLGRYSNQTNWGTAWNTTGPTFITKAEFIRQVLNRYGATGKFLMNTESALIIWGVSGSTDATFALTRAYYVTQAYATAIAINLRGNLWFSMYGWFSSELITDGNPNKAFEAYDFASKKLGAARYSGAISSADLNGATGVRGYKFDRGDRRIWVIWSADGSDRSVNLSNTPVERYDLWGNSAGSGKSFTVGIMPLYVEWNP